MAFASLIPKNGAVVWGSYVADFASFDIEAAQAVDGITPYGAATESVNVGSGTPDFSFNVGAFVGAHASNSPPQLAGASNAFTSVGATLTLTLDTGVSEGCTAVLARYRISHARMRGFVPAALSLRNGRGGVTETWATT